VLWMRVRREPTPTGARRTPPRRISRVRCAPVPARPPLSPARASARPAPRAGTVRTVRPHRARAAAPAARGGSFPPERGRAAARARRRAHRGRDAGVALFRDRLAQARGGGERALRGRASGRLGDPALPPPNLPSVEEFRRTLEAQSARIVAQRGWKATESITRLWCQLAAETYLRAYGLPAGRSREGLRAVSNGNCRRRSARS